MGFLRLMSLHRAGVICSGVDKSLVSDMVMKKIERNEE